MKEGNEIRLLKSKRIEKEKGFLHFFTSRTGGKSENPYSSLNLGLSSGDDTEDVLENWRILASATGIEMAETVMPKQVHSDGILLVGGSEDFRKKSGRFNPPEGDAVILACRGASASVITADCVPVIVVCRNAAVGAVIHSGWRGTALNIAGKTVREMIERFSIRPDEIIAAIGPSIGFCCYEVGEEVFVKFKELFGNNEKIIKEENGKFFVSLKDAVFSQIKEEGVLLGNIEIFNICTSCKSELFFSYRRDRGVTGRQASVLKIL